MNDTSRAQAAKLIVDSIQNQQVVRNMSSLCDAYIQLANLAIPTPDNKTNTFPLAPHILLLRCSNLEMVPVPTHPLPISPQGRYEDFVSIVKFATLYKIVGGINQPKLIECTGSDGKTYMQLVKGKDDLRQDAVMEQVFGVLNVLLAKERDARIRDLQMRTYKVIPMAANSGVLQWVTNTKPMTSYLAYAHAKQVPVSTLMVVGTIQTTFLSKNAEKP
jgi:ataxia telangiectasia mutated family protein